MDNIRYAIEEVENSIEKYGLDSVNIKDVKEHFNDYKVFVPLIGRFSAGKSALINNVLGYSDFLNENIGPETAVPTEIFFSDENKVYIRYQDEKSEYITPEEYWDKLNQFSIENTKFIRLCISNNERLEKFYNVALVDMPGLDSGYEIHDRAIEEYIRNSMAYALVFPADELTVPESMIPILRDLNAYNMPMCVVITKGNRIKDIREQKAKEVRENLKKYFDNNIRVFVTEKEDGYADEFIEFLCEMNGRADELGQEFYKKKLLPEFTKLLNYLTGYLKNMDLTLSELEEQKENLERDIVKTNDNVNGELEQLVNDIPNVVNAIAGDIQVSLSRNLDSYVYDVVNGGSVQNAINETVRSALIDSYEKRVSEKLKNHLKKIAESLTVNGATVSIDLKGINDEGISGVGLTAAAAISGLIYAGTIVGIVIGVVGGLISLFASDKAKNEKRAQQENEAKMKLTSNVFPSIDKEIREKVEIDLRKVVMEVKKNVEGEVSKQIEALQKSLDEVIAKKQIEDESDNAKRFEIENDIKLLREIQESI